MPRTDLSVFYSDREKVKALGAKWDTNTKVWYIPEGSDPNPFKQWLIVSHPPPNIRSNIFFIATARQNCRKCESSLKMMAFVLPMGWEKRGTEDEEVDELWMPQESNVILNYIAYINDEILSVVQEISPDYRLGLMGGHRTRKYYNHCNDCGAMQREPNSGDTHIFKPLTCEQAQQITLHEFHLSFECYSSYQANVKDDSIDFFALMKRLPKE